MLRDYFHATFSRYEQLFEVLTCEEAYLRKPIALRHPLIFYSAIPRPSSSTSCCSPAGAERINPRFESMFAVGVDEMSWDDLNEAHYDWPAVQEVRDYRRQVRRTGRPPSLTHAPLTLPIGWEQPWWAIIMGIEHERIHLETSSVLIRQHALSIT
jgi:hypothetical protein